MKIAIDCDSMLLQKSLEIFLKEFKSIDNNNYDFLISDKLFKVNKPLLFISNSSNQAYLKKPFSKSKLLTAIEKFYNENIINKNSNDNLKVQIEDITKEFVEKLLITIKGHYER